MAKGAETLSNLGAEGAEPLSNLVAEDERGLVQGAMAAGVQRAQAHSDKRAQGKIKGPGLGK